MFYVQGENKVLRGQYMGNYWIIILDFWLITVFFLGDPNGFSMRIKGGKKHLTIAVTKAGKHHYTLFFHGQFIVAFCGYKLKLFLIQKG